MVNCWAWGPKGGRGWELEMEPPSCFFLLSASPERPQSMPSPHPVAGSCLIALHGQLWGSWIGVVGKAEAGSSTPRPHSLPGPAWFAHLPRTAGFGPGAAWELLCEELAGLTSPTWHGSVSHPETPGTGIRILGSLCQTSPLWG